MGSHGLGSLGLTAPCLWAALESLTSGLLPSLFLQQALPSVLPQRGLHVAEAGEAVHGPRRQSCWRESPEEGACAAWGCGSRHPKAPSSPAFPPARAESLKSWRLDPLLSHAGQRGGRGRAGKVGGG